MQVTPRQDLNWERGMTTYFRLFNFEPLQNDVTGCTSGWVAGTQTPPYLPKRARLPGPVKLHRRGMRSLCLLVSGEMPDKIVGRTAWHSVPYCQASKAYARTSRNAGISLHTDSGQMVKLRLSISFSSNHKSKFKKINSKLLPTQLSRSLVASIYCRGSQHSPDF